ncbi:uncharacterized protein LOC110463539 [Mizuhopecten yessoensis]|uniref:WD repeat and SOCS box-containing protein 1 n=1 Tax=Mizuhopecten yessoensis TaxID=6573 RepID=A0A210PVV4_MIZYE|nr:uncharacterized protein LOC110463539 [Mizuhopecten yessoensis]XP_021373873.1 uncharacterized protein LOC110463539 [Mizuhopecten yessoensis]XP_021373875.1 uncharacterized protein LOC110463539 [Mizuhopecten yessoensis]OWF40628.1 WD repeat and SOCS box-containing protein 1 [Mizuhopecten yessoensis]
MGVSFNKPRIVTVRGSYYKESERAVPLYTYTPFPERWNRPTGSLITRVKAVPNVKEEENDLYWWTDCEFLPNNDSTVVTTCSSFTIQPNQALTVSRAIQPGKVCLFDLSSEKNIKCGYYRQASVASFPKLQTFPDGDHIVYLGSTSGDIKVMSLERSTFHSRAQDIHFRAYKYVAVSPSGCYFAIMARTSRQYQYELLIYDSHFVTRAESVIDCCKMNDFRGSRMNLEHTVCKWSPDSEYVAAAISHGHLCIVSRRSQACVCDVFTNVIPDRALSRGTTFDFNPMSCHRMVSVGTKDRFLYIIDIQEGNVLCQTEHACGDHAIDVVKFSCDGLFVGVALHNFSVQLFSPVDCSLLYSFSMKDSLPSLHNSMGPHASVLNLTFSSTGEQAVTSTADGYVSFWQLPRKMELQVICKFKILSCVSLDRVSRLPLPPRLKDFLLSLPTML